jgi:ABC-type glycerol-3-phosphate transport system substrate-binding protein
VYAYVGYDVTWRSAPSYRRDGPPGSILGGVGAAVLSGTADATGAARLAAWLGSTDVQLEVVRPAGGQPATRSGWTAPGGDPLFAALEPTLEAARLRPRDAWWPDFQTASGELLAHALTARREPPALAEELARLYHDHREATP